MVVHKMLDETKLMSNRLGQLTVAILIGQDLAFIIMIISLKFLQDKMPSMEEILVQLFGGAMIFILVFYMGRKKKFDFPLSGYFPKEKELQVLFALLLCFGCAFIAGLLGFSAGLGAFLGGVVVASAREMKWVHDTMESFKVLFIVLFFLSIGMQLNLSFFIQNWIQILSLVIIILLTNTIINSVIFRIMGFFWKTSLYTATLLAQIGEFRFVLALMGFEYGIITHYGYQLTISTIVISLSLTWIWVTSIKRVFLSI